MLTEELTNYCDINYKRNCPTENCGHCDVTCTHPMICPKDCEQCLEQIHFPARNPKGRLDYTCNNVLNFYVCKYFYKYASEIEYALHTINSLPYKDTLNILSLGCGASPDLAAFESYLYKNGFSTPINYLGIDINPLWKDKHEFIKRYFSSTPCNPQYLYTDVTEVFKDHYVADKNILILQYLISHFYNTGKLSAVNEFYKNMCSNIIKRMQPHSIIIINDVNSNRRGRDLFLRFSDTLSKYNIKHTYSCRYFEYNIQNDYQRYGIKYPGKTILSWPAQTLARYNPWTVCSSAQLIIELE